MSILILMLISLANKHNYNQYLVLIDTDSETISNKINCTNQIINNHYNHADSSLAYFQQPQKVLHFVVQDSSLQIKEEYLQCALLQLFENHLGSVIAIPLNSLKGFSQNILDHINMISEKYDILFYIAQHPLNESYPQSNAKIIYVKREKQFSSSELAVLFAIKTIL
ncbi:unnamed protein product [Paramecium sonneborni]|uniref:Uncharacterized protein n=1 Tax=Paramecium sonneborni TaxID=65129 RepID=A0A8S1LZP6_9CILI|nr:unnamed protein product [Paramecium sonneborni]